MSYSKNETINDLVERRVDKLFNEFFTDCPIGRKSISGCPAIGDGKTSHHLSSKYATQFFTECPYGKKATAECPYGKEIVEKAHKGKASHFHGHGHSSGKIPEYATEFFTECPYGRRVADQCPYGHDILEKAHKKTIRAHHSHGHARHPDYAQEFFTECPYGKKAADQCPYGKEILEKAHKKAVNSHHHGNNGHPDYVEEFFTECPYGKKVADQCPYGHEILEKASKSSSSRRSSSAHSDYVDEFFLECPYGKKAAEECPYGHNLLEKAGVDVPPLKKHEEGSQEPSKCPFAAMASPGDKCPISGAADATASATKSAGKCPVGGVMPQSEKCPISPNYKKPFVPVVDSYETENDFKFFVELPGAGKGDIKLDIKDKLLTLSGEVKTTAEETEGNACFTERTLGAFSRTISLHNNVSVDKIKAKLENGILAITVPKGVPSVKKSITIN
ncbi:heat-shock protein [Mucor ambiguus]|uniref:Heat-shock protein n=1 Tax=Mucor ambiguus TaxID=91626 RepID=A0A0C9ME26_9FUNG|nr:heat-shock protein [Mucor ambiguus]